MMYIFKQVFIFWKSVCFVFKIVANLLSSKSLQSRDSGDGWDLVLTENMKSASLGCLGSSVMSSEAAAVTVCPNKTSYVSDFLTNWDFQPKQFLSDQSWTCCNPQRPHLQGILKLHCITIYMPFDSVTFNGYGLLFWEYASVTYSAKHSNFFQTPRVLNRGLLVWIRPAFYCQMCVRWGCGVFDSMSLDNDLQANKEVCLF